MVAMTSVLDRVEKGMRCVCALTQSLEQHICKLRLTTGILEVHSEIATLALCGLLSISQALDGILDSHFLRMNRHGAFEGERRALPCQPVVRSQG